MLDKKPNFTEFRSFGARIGSNYIGITQGGTISFYTGCYRKYEIEKFKNCIILYDKTQKLLGLQFGGDELGEGAYPINHDVVHKTGSVPSRNFFRMNLELSLVELKGKYTPEVHNSEEKKNVLVLVVDLTHKAE